ncbi:MAG: NAD(P)/FAD-dependent oxidoreductase [Xanthomonadales bacterium]|nr:NAD(P)/FAD-dependent oxidoreductase [Xanthomonadales bacterium]
MSKSDRELGMGRDISRRDFIQGTSLASLGLTLPAGVALGQGDPAAQGRYYPPTRTGLRGSHPGSFDAAHAIAREGLSFESAEPTGEHYDLVVVGGGLSGLATALYYQDLFGKNTRILILENHDDFGGHAKRNEFHQGGAMRLALGGVHNLEYTSFSPNAQAMMDRLGIDFEAIKAQTGFYYGEEGRGSPCTWFDAEHFREDVLLRDFSLAARDFLNNPEQVGRIPVSDQARDRLVRFSTLDTHIWPQLEWEQIEARLRAISYFDFLREHAGLDDECLDVFNNFSHGVEGWSVVNMSAYEAMDIGLPGWNLLGQGLESEEWDYPMVMFPDGNASVARLMVQQLIPTVSPGTTVENVSVADFDYEQLDRSKNQVRIRLNATAVRVKNITDGVQVNYWQDGRVLAVQARHAVLACYHSIIPHLCPEMPAAQKEAQQYQVKCPLLLTNVLLRDQAPLKRAGISVLRCPGRLHSRVLIWQGNTAGGYADGAWDTPGAVNLTFWGMIKEPPGELTLKERLRASRYQMLGMELADYEREVRQVLDQVWGPHGLDVKEDVLAVSVNRWPHGYSYYYTDLWDPDFEAGQYPHEVASQRFGNIAIANADALADAYTHAAIDVAARAVKELRSA